MKGEENQFVLNYAAIGTIRAPRLLLSSKGWSTRENWIIVIKSFGDM